MGLPACYLPIIKTVLAQLSPDAGGRIRALSLGYPDLLARAEQLAQVFGPSIVRGLKPRADVESVHRTHGLRAELPVVFETVAFFDALGVTLDCIDIAATRGFERVADLNQPLPADLQGSYDLVLDFGTTEHCFNFGQAIANGAGALAAHGCIMHATPLNMFNHGFFNFNPTLYADFYTQDGFELLMLNGISGDMKNPVLFNVPAMGRFHDVPRDSVLVAVARRTRVQPIVWPIQGKYKPAVAATA
jgi:hypothetical protein